MKIMKIQIKRKRDWVLTGVFAFLIVYMLLISFKWNVNQFLLGFTTYKIGDFNQPTEQGIMTVAAFVTLLFLLILMAWQKKSRKSMLLVAVIGIVVMGLILASYYVECQLILTSIDDLEPNISITRKDSNGEMDELEYDAETTQEIIEKILCLKPVKGSRVSDYAEEDDEFYEGNRISISIWYPQRYHHSYHISVWITDDTISIIQFGLVEKNYVYEDNGLRELLDEKAVKLE